MPYKVPTYRNNPIATVIMRFLEREKGMVVESRKEIQRRFDGLDWEDQKWILLVFLSSGKGDREWAYEQLLNLWDDEFFSLVKNLYEAYHENKCQLVVINYFPTSYVLEHADELASGDYYFEYCSRLAYEHVDFQPDRQKLTPKTYLRVIADMGKSIDAEEACDVLFDVLHDLATDEVSRYDGVSPKHKIPIGTPFVASDFLYVYMLIELLQNIDCQDALAKFEDWQNTLYTTILQSKEFKALNVKLPYDYSYKRRRIAKRYIYELLPEKYKSPSDATPFASNEDLFEKMKDKNPSLTVLSEKFELDISEY